MSTRQRFTSAERDAFTSGTEVEYLHGNRWYPAVVQGAIETDTMTLQYLTLERRHALTRTQWGATVRGYAKHVRLPQAQRTGTYV